MFSDHIITGTSLYKLTVPIYGIQSDLYEFDLRMLGKNTIQKLRGRVERNTQMTDLSFFLPLLCMIKQICGFYDTAVTVVAIIVYSLNIMKQIVVDIINPEIVQLTLKCLFDFVLDRKSVV